MGTPIYESPEAKKKIESAFNIAKKTLQQQYAPNGIHAGSTHFSDLWCRDCCFASFGSLALGDTDIVKKSLESLLSKLKDNGQVPLRIGQKHLLLKYLNIKGKNEARYMEDKNISPPTDGNSLFIITCKNYIDKTKDIDFIKTHYSQLKRVIQWNFSQDKDHDLLIEEGFYASWTDSLKKSGKVLYTNVLHCRALECFSDIAKIIDEKGDQNVYLGLSKVVKEKINTLFWNGSYYIDWTNHKKHHYFSTDGNALAMIFGIASDMQAKKIEEMMRLAGMNTGFCVSTNYPKYRHFQLFSIFLFINLKDYHNGLKWLWVGCIDAVAKYRRGLEEPSKLALYKIAEKILEFNGVYEVYYHGKPLNRLVYKSEKDFAWSSGLFVWACHELGYIK